MKASEDMAKLFLKMNFASKTDPKYFYYIHGDKQSK